MLFLAVYAMASFADESSDDAGQGGIIITEIQSANIDQFLDSSRNYGGWVELYNASQSSVSLTGCWVSDDPSNLMKVNLTQPMTIEPEAYYNLWFDHHDINPIQVDMKLDVEGGTIYLSDSNGNLITSQAYPQGVSRCSYAHKSLSDDEWAMTSTPTPIATNDGSTFCTKRLDAPIIDKDSQIFDTTLTVQVNIPEGTTLRYTTDGSAPTTTNGETSSTGLFYPTETTVYRFSLTQDGYLPSQVVTRTYIYKDKDFPLPVFSVASANDNLYSDDYGIFVYDNRTKDWDRPANFEYFDADGQIVVNQETSIKRTGGATRIYEPYAFKVNANKQYELQNYLPYDFFAEKPYLKHKTVVMRSGGNDPKCRIKDAALQEIVMRSGIDIDCQAYQPAMHYINGKYAGTINVREPSNKKYVYANYGLDDDEIDLLEMLYYFRQKCGTYDSMQRWLDLAAQCASGDEEAYEQIKQLVDIDEYCNYMAVELFLCNSDWPHNNLKVWRPITDGGKFRHITYDLDHAFTTTTPFTNLADVSYHYSSLDDCEEVRLFFDMLGSDSFRKQFIDTFCLVAGSVFEPTRCKDIITELCDRVEASQILANDVYSDTNVTPWTTGNTLISNLTASYQTMMIDTLKNYSPMGLSSTTAQSVTLSANIDEARLLINNLPVPTNAFSGQLFSPITFKAEAPAGYKFLGWRERGKRGVLMNTYVSTDEEYEMPTASDTIILVACYREMSDEEKAEEGLTTTPIVINEVSASNSVNVNEYFKKDDWVELYNTTSDDIDLEGMYMTDESAEPHQYQITAAGTKANTIIPAHGYKIIWCSKRETETELHANFKLGNNDGEMVRICASDDSWADSLVYCAHNGDQSVGRYPDGGENVYLMTKPTIKSSNLMNTYATLWSGEEGSTDIEDIYTTTTRNGGMSIACVGDYLSIKSEESDHVTLGVHTLSGITVMYRNVSMEGGHGRVNISALPSGIYVAHATDEEGDECATKFVKK